MSAAEVRRNTTEMANHLRFFMSGTGFYDGFVNLLKSTDMKRIFVTRTFGLIVLLALSMPATAGAGAPASAAEGRAIQLEHRLAEIKALDKESLSRSEKKQLRKEVREIKKELAAISGGVYLSIGAIILIALLLILLL